MLGAMRGPKSFEAAGELSDGCHHALSYTREAYDYPVRHIRAGAERAGTDWRSLDSVPGWSPRPAGPPEECLARIEWNIAPSGVNHMICAITDRAW